MKIDSVDSYNGAVTTGQQQRIRTEEVQSAKAEASVKLENARELAVEEAKSLGASKGYSEKDIQDAVEKVNQYAEIQKVNLQLEVEKELKTVIVKVVDKDTDEVIRQIPSEQTIALAKRLDEVMKEFLTGQSGSAFSLLSDEV